MLLLHLVINIIEAYIVLKSTLDFSVCGAHRHGSRQFLKHGAISASTRSHIKGNLNTPGIAAILACADLLVHDFV